MLRFPKPHGGRAKLVFPPEQEAVDFIARMLAGADLLDVETTNELGFTTRWLLVPVGHAELEFLAAYRAEREDLEHGADMEESGDEHEPSLGAANVGHNFDQSKWGTPSSSWDADCELDDSDREPDQDDWDHVEARSPETVPDRQVRRSNSTGWAAMRRPCGRCCATASWTASR